MRKYNVNNKYIIKAKSYVDAVNVVKKLKDTKLKDKYEQHGLVEFVINDKQKAYDLGFINAYNEGHSEQGLRKHAKMALEAADFIKKLESKGYKRDPDKAFSTDSLKDDESDIEFLSKEEKQAIEDYKKAISNTNDLKLLRLFAHILKEEIEHLEELRNEEIEDTLKDKKPTDYKALAKELQQKFHTKFVYDPDLGGIEAPYVWGNWKLDQEIVKYLKSKGYKVEWDSIGDDGFYYFKDSIEDAEEANTVLRKYQEWVDYDMKHYHKISEETLSKLKKAGLEVVKDKYGDYEVIARG